MSQPRKMWPRTKLMMSAGHAIHAGSSGMGFMAGAVSVSRLPSVKLALAAILSGDS
jgi:hypothetical protein